MPCTNNSACPLIGTTAEDMAQPGYENQWGAQGRDDLSIIRHMGANAIRLYHPIGIEKDAEPDHGKFLDYAKTTGLKIFGAVHQYLHCDGDDCFKSWNYAVEQGLKAGFNSNGEWHSAVWALNMINEVDIMGISPDKQVKRIISAVDGLLAAEKKLGVKGGVHLTSCFSTALAGPLGGGAATIYHGFSSIEAWIKNPSLVPYTPQSMSSVQDLAAEIDKRWIHCMNAQIPWKGGLDHLVANVYEAQFPKRQWFLGEMGWNGIHHDVIEEELNTMYNFSKNGKGFAGTFVFQFQTAYEKTGDELNYGLFGLGDKDLGVKAEISGTKYPVQCLTSRLAAFENPSAACKDDCNHRAQGVMGAFGGKFSGDGLCLSDSPVSPVAPPKPPTVAV